MSVISILLSKQVSMETTKTYEASYDWAMPVHDVGLPNKDDICLTQSEVVVLPRYSRIQF